MGHVDFGQGARSCRAPARGRPRPSASPAGATPFSSSRLVRKSATLLIVLSRRAKERCRTWTGGVAHDAAEMAAADLEFWMAATAGERVRGVTMLIDDMRWMRGDLGPGPRLQRAVGGVRPRCG